MLEINGEKIYLGDFHTHWYWDKENSALFIAGIYNLGFDFVLLADGWKRAIEIDNFCKLYEIPFRVFPGRELMFEFAHIVCWINEESDLGIVNKIPKKNPWKFLKENSPAVKKVKL